MQYLCDRMEPPIPCELVRGYLDFMPHAWNIVLVKKGDSLVRMIVDACHPHDIREETDPEYYCRLVPFLYFISFLVFSFGQSIELLIYVLGCVTHDILSFFFMEK